MTRSAETTLSIAFLQGTIALALLGAAASCGGGSNPSPTPNPTPTPTPSPTITVSVAPATSQVILGNSAAFTATVTGSTNAAVTWSLSGAGALDTVGNYTAPADLPSSATASITATSHANTAISGSAAATIISDITISIQTMPAQASLIALGGTLALTAPISSKGKPDTSVIWNVNGVPGGNAAIGTITGSAPATYTAPSALPASTQIVIAAVSKADPSKTATLPLTLMPPVGVTVSNTSPIPLTPLQVSTTSFTPTMNTTLSFSDGQSFSFQETPIRIADGGIVVAAVPLYITASGATTAGTVSMTMTESGVTTQPVQLNIQALPSVASYGVQPGQMAHALFVHQAIVTAQSVNAFEAANGSVNNAVDTSAATSSFKTMLQSTLAAKNDVDRVAANPGLSIVEGTLQDGSQITFDANGLDLMDRVVGVMLSGQFGTLVQSASSSAAPARARVKHRFVSPKRPASLSRRPVASAGGFKVKFRRIHQAHSRALPRGSTFVAGLLGTLESFADSTTVTLNLVKAVNAAQQAGTSATQTILDEFSAISGGIGPIVGQFNKLFGAYAGALGSTNTIVQCITDDALYFTFVVTGQQGAANLVAQDLDSISAKDLADATVSILTINQSAAVEAASALYTFTSNVIGLIDVSSTSGGENLMTANQTTQAVLAESTIIDSPGPNGIGLVDGMVTITNNEGTEQPELGIAMDPAPGSGAIDTVTDPEGNFSLLVPLGQPSFDYASSDFTITDDSDNTLATETYDLSAASNNMPVALNPVTTTEVPADRFFAIAGVSPDATTFATTSATVNGVSLGTTMVDDGYFVVCAVPDGTPLNIDLETNAALTLPQVTGPTAFVGFVNLDAAPDGPLTSDSLNVTLNASSCSNGVCPTADDLIADGVTIVNSCTTIPGVNDRRPPRKQSR